MIIEMEVLDLMRFLTPPTGAEELAATSHATLYDLYFEEGNEIEESELFAVLFNDKGTCEIVAPASGVLISLRYEEGSTVALEAVLTKIQTDR